MAIYEINFIGTFKTVVVPESEIKFYKGDENVSYIEEIKECQTCGQEKELDVVGWMARCTDCRDRYYKAMKRANMYLNSREEY